MKTANDPISLDQLHELLAYVDANTPRDEWVTVLMAIKSEFGELGKQYAQAWSAAADSYNAIDFLSTWKSIKAAGAVTIGTLIHQAKANGWTSAPITDQDRRRLKQERKQRQREQAEKAKAEALEIEQQQIEAAHCARTLLSRASNQIDHPYLLRKQVHRHGALVIQTPDYPNALLIPIFGTQEPFKESLQNVQIIYEDGTKRFLKGGKKSGGYFPVQWIEGAPIVICEGFATGATLAEHYTPNSSVICAFDAGNLLPVARALRHMCQKTRIILAADNDRFTKGGQPADKNAGIEAATKAARAIDGGLIIPEFADHEQGSDWNDRYLLDIQGVNRYEY